MQAYLDNTYWETMQATAQGMVDQNAIWYIGATAYGATAETAYTSAQTASWMPHKIGLLASYEYLYAASGSSCYTTAGSSYNNSCAATDWLWPVLTNNKASTGWLLNPSSSGSANALYVNNSNLSGNVASSTVNNNRAVSPVVYLKSGVTIIGGSGTSVSPYKLYMPPSPLAS